MNLIFLRMRRAGLLALAGFLLVPLALAQETKERVATDEDAQKVIIQIENGQRSVIVDGEVLSDEEAEAFLKTWNERDHDGHGVRRFRIGPEGAVRFGGEMPHGARFRPRMPEAEFFIKPGDGMRPEEMFFMRAPEAPMVGMLGHGSMKGHAELARMDAESQRLARQVLEASGAERDRLEAELRDKLAEIFARKQTLRAEHIEEMKAHLGKLETEQSERAAARQQIIDRRLKMLLGERDRYDW